MYKFALVLRFLRRRKITLFPIIGVALGVLALVVVLSIMQGFETDFKNRIRGISPDLSLDFRTTDGFVGDTDELITALEAIEEVRAVSPYIRGLGLAEAFAPSKNPGEKLVYDGYVQFKGFDFERESRVLDLSKYLQYGKDVFAENPYTGDASAKPPAFIVGARFAGKKHEGVRTKETDWGALEAGTEVMVSTFTPSYEMRRFKGKAMDFVASGIYDIDEHLLYMPLDWARALKEMAPGSISGVSIALTQYDKKTIAAAMENITAVVEKHAAFTPYRLTTWEEERRAFLMAVAMERRIMAFILFFFLVVAGFSISAILIMIVLEKIRDIGILRAMGASAQGVAGLFLVYGITIAVIGAGLGLVGGVVFVKNLDSIEQGIYKLTGWQPFPPEIYDLPEIPRILNWWTNMSVVAAALAVSFAASVIPALRAAWLDPVEAIRYE